MLTADGSELLVATQGLPLGLADDPEYLEGSLRIEGSTGVLLYTDGLSESRRDGAFFGLAGIRAALGQLEQASPVDTIAHLHTQVAGFGYGSASDDVCMLVARIG